MKIFTKIGVSVVFSLSVFAPRLCASFEHFEPREHETYKPMEHESTRERNIDRRGEEFAKKARFETANRRQRMAEHLRDERAFEGRKENMQEHEGLDELRREEGFKAAASSRAKGKAELGRDGYDHFNEKVSPGGIVKKAWLKFREGINNLQAFVGENLIWSKVAPHVKARVLADAYDTLTIVQDKLRDMTAENLEPNLSQPGFGGASEKLQALSSAETRRVTSAVKAAKYRILRDTLSMVKKARAEIARLQTKSFTELPAAEVFTYDRGELEQFQRSAMETSQGFLKKIIDSVDSMVASVDQTKMGQLSLETKKRIGLADKKYDELRDVGPIILKRAKPFENLPNVKKRLRENLKVVQLPKEPAPLPQLPKRARG